MYEERSYRNLVYQDNLVSFRVAVKETDLFVYAAKHFEEVTRELVLKHRGYVEAYILENQGFAKTLD